MLSKGDDYPIHQTPEPIAYAGTDRNFYDRYFFNGYAPDGADFFAVAFGVYPHLNIADAHFAVVRDGVQYNLHASCFLGMERMKLEVGPIRIVVEEPLQRLRLIVQGSHGFAADLLFQGRAFPIEEPRFIYRVGPRSLMDYTRLTQNGRYVGWIELDGKRKELPQGSMGTRDRSWGVRPIGERDSQPHVPAMEPGFLWQWCPLNFAEKSVFYHIKATGQGHVWNTRAAIVRDDGGAADIIETTDAAMAVEFGRGTRHARSGVLTINAPSHPTLRIAFEPVVRFQMSGIGYQNPEWGHGSYHGELTVARDQYRLDEVDVNDPLFLHIQAFSRLTLTQDGRAPEHGIGVFEQLILGYKPLGLANIADTSGMFAGEDQG